MIQKLSARLHVALVLAALASFSAGYAVTGHAQSCPDLWA